MKVIGFGDSVVDRYVNKGVMYPGGNCLNFSVYASKLGADSSFLGMIGDDMEGQFILSALDEMNVDHIRCTIEEGSVTEHCDVTIDPSGNRIFECDDERDEIHDGLILTEDDIDYLKDFDLIHSGCFAEEESEIPKLGAMPGIVAFDFSEQDEFRTDEYLDAICPYIDFALFSCEHMEQSECEAFAKAIYARGVKYVLITRGPYGQIFYDGSRFYHGKAVSIEAVDTMGAGDSFFTAFLISLLRAGWTKQNPPTADAIEEALAFAAQFAANSCLSDGSFGLGRAIPDRFTNRICINNFPYRRHTFPYFLKSAKRLGISRLELSGCHPHFTKYEAAEFDTEQLAQQIREYGLTVSFIEPEQNFLPINIASGQEYLWEQSVSDLSFYIRCAGAFDCDKVIIYPGKGAMDQPFEEALDNAVRALRRLCGVAAECGVKVLLQNVSSCISNLTTTLEDFRHIYELVGKDNLYVSVNSCPVYAAGESLDAWFEAFGDRILNLQLSDSDENGDEQLTIGEGEQDFRAYLDTVRKYGYGGDITLEITEEECADEPEGCYEESIKNIVEIAEEAAL